LTLPTYNQWVAAAISYANPEKAVIRDKQQFLGLKPQQRSEKQASGNLLPFLYPEKTSDGVLDLLGNLREWSIDSSCPDESYHYILGGDYNTWQDNIGGEPICEMGLSDMVGFRLILRENK
jgi:formylglycine-generating enzyme required for sulfatase activity